MTAPTPDEFNCLNHLDALTEPSDQCIHFEPIVRGTGYPRAKVRRHIRALARKGYAEYHRGLTDEDGAVAGAGYCITSQGRDLIQSPTQEEDPE